MTKKKEVFKDPTDETLEITIPQRTYMVFMIKAAINGSRLEDEIAQFLTYIAEATERDGIDDHLRHLFKKPKTGKEPKND